MMRFSPSFLLSGRALLAALALALAAPLALADLSLYPTRIVLEKNQRAAQVELMNNGTAPETYRINLVNRRMGETGEFIALEAPGPGDQFADPLLRYSPKQVTVQPGSSQTVRILLRKPADLAPGEYRSHLQFDRVADATGASSIEQAGKPGDKEIGVVITALVGASIPVIVRQGETQASVTLSDLALLPATGDAGPALGFVINRSGNGSVYGDLNVSFTPKGGKPVDLAKAGALAVYVPNALRRARMVLQVPPGTALAGGTLNLSYRERAEAGGKMMAEASLTLP
ncbi:fimbrial chaperone protein [Polaromonas sp. CG_9.5]|uniref:molecular chaperone n=1 Tax=Polaromonas sp. CG_9.5 TaxID=3071705 RepID=UPI002DFB6832|nr:fimbrial chaperone protein [Polaromonas sp. CG_9.5]